MIACISKTLLKQKNVVQKDVDIESILNRLEYFNDVKEALEKGYVPVSFITSIRTAYSNLVVKHNDKYYVSLNLAEVLPHKGYDLLMFMSSSAVAKVMDCTKRENQNIMFNSQFMPIGVYNPDVGICNPIIYCHIIVKDELAERLEKALLDGNTLELIESMDKTNNISALLNEIIEVKDCEVIDVTFHGGRKQSEILREAGIVPETEKEPEVPVSLTPEQLEQYCISMVQSTKDQHKRRVYAHFMKLIKENESMKQELRRYKLKELRETASEETPDDIQE